MKRQYWINAASLLLCLYGSLVMGGWLFRFPIWEKITPYGVQMVFLTAFCFTLGGIGLTAPRLFGGRARPVGIATGCLLMTIALLMLAETFFSVDLGVDLAQFHRWYVDNNPHPGRMAPNTALGFLLAGAALLLGFAGNRIGPLIHALPAATAALGLIGLAGYTQLFNLAYGWYNIPHMALITAICMLVLGSALMLSYLDTENVTGRQIVSHSGSDGVTAFNDAKVYAFFGVAITILAAVFFVSYGSIKALIERNAWVAHSGEVRTEFETLIALDAQAYNAWRSFLVTHDADDLNRMHAAGALMFNRLTHLQQTTADNPAQLKRLKAMQALVETNIALLKTGKATRQNDQQFNQPETVPSKSTLTANREEFESLVAAFRTEENRLLAQRQEESRIGVASTINTIVIGNLLGLSIMLYAAWLLKRLNAARDKLERNLQQSEERARFVIENVTDYAIITLDLAGHILSWNTGAERIKGYRADEIIGQHISRLYLPEDIARGEPDRILSTAATEGHCEREGWRLRKDGTKFWANVIFTPLRDNAEQLLGFIKITRDLTERKEAEEQLLRNNIFLDSMLENLPVAVFVKDAENLRYVRVNKAGEALYGIARTEILGKNNYDFLPREEADFFTARDHRTLKSVSTVDIAEENINTRHRGVRIVHTTKIPVMNENGRASYLLGIAEDITKRKQAEQQILALNTDLEARAAELEVVNKELESFSYSVSHDLRAPLRAINGYALMLDEDYRGRLDDTGLRYISQIRGYSSQMGALIDDLLRFSRLGRQALKMVKVNMNELLQDILQTELDTWHDKHVAPEIEIADLPVTTADPLLLRQVWANLIANALKYSSKAEVPRIRISGYVAGNNAVYSIRDNGVGFDMAYYDKLFSVFQRLHRSDEFPGTGVGLAIVQRVVTRHGGKVWAQGSVNQGAEFFFALPLNETGYADEGS